MSGWNPWHGCTKVGEGCRNCFLGVEAANGACVLTRNRDFDLPVRRDNRNRYILQNDGDYVYTCFTSDFLHPQADAWRPAVWQFMRERTDLNFLFLTKRINRFYAGLPFDWEEGYENVSIGCSCEDERSARARLPVFFEAPIAHRFLVFQPLLEPINIEPYLLQYGSDSIRGVVCGGESGANARLCDFSWILSLRAQCEKFHIPFRFKQTGAFFRKDGTCYHLSKPMQLRQAAKADIDLYY